ncbi:hypothetical protein AAKU67_002707 [Oxalobacteraceae bacterium GrIS 2.11]
MICGFFYGIFSKPGRFYNFAVKFLFMDRNSLLPLGYHAITQRFQLQTLPLDSCALLDSRLMQRQSRQSGGRWIELFGASYQPEDSLKGHLQFALRYEGINLQVLAILFSQSGHIANIEAELCAWLSSSPESRYARIACFLYEWITQKRLPIDDPVSPRASYQPALDETQQFGLCAGTTATGEKLARFRILNNLPGNLDFCPLVRKTPYLKEMVAKDLRQRTEQVLASYDQALLSRAAAYLYLKETQSSFEVEREQPSAQRARRFVDLLRRADTREPLSADRLIELQHAVLDPRFHEFCWRTRQNWIGKDLEYRHQIDFVPPRPEELASLMQGLIAMANQDVGRIDAVVLATSIAFGFVYLHPFMDGNGRIHRYLIHDLLAKAGFTPRGIVLPVSAVILANLENYVATLEHFSRPLNRLTDYHPDTPDIAAHGNDAVYFRYPDFTRQAEFLYSALERTVEQDVQQEINYLLGFDKAYKALNGQLDWPPHTLELFIQITHSNAGRLSAKKRKSHFGWMSEHEVELAQQGVRQAFDL